MWSLYEFYPPLQERESYTGKGFIITERGEENNDKTNTDGSEAPST